jgi:Outer membrane protein beta-barrel domain
MKKSIILIIITMLAATVTQSQFSFGPRAGLNISKENYSNTTVYSTASHNFFTGGIFANYLTKKNIAVELSVNYSAEGTEESNKTGSTNNGVVTIKRINIPLLVQYHTKPGVYFETGPQIGFMTDAFGNYTTGHYDFKKYTQSTLTSWCFGAGYILKQTVPGLGVNASYAKGLSHIEKGTVNAGKITGTTFSVKLFYGFQLKKKK